MRKRVKEEEEVRVDGNSVSNAGVWQKWLFELDKEENDNGGGGWEKRGGRWGGWTKANGSDNCDDKGVVRGEEKKKKKRKTKRKRMKKMKTQLQLLPIDFVIVIICW